MHAGGSDPGRDAKKLKIPGGTQSGDVLKLRGRGIPHPRGRQVGDLLVQVLIDVPKKLTQRQRELLTELAELEHTHVTAPRKSFFEEATRVFRARRLGPDGGMTW